jgi:hypothetical protein
VQTKPHVERLARLLHNRVVRRVLAAHPTANALLLVGDLVDGFVQLHPTSIWDADGVVLHDFGGKNGGTPGRWRALVDDLQPEFALLGRFRPVELFVPYVLDLRQLDLRLEADDRETG